MHALARTGLILALFSGGVAAANLPPDRTVAYVVLTDPNDPNSERSAEFHVEFVALEASGNQVWWDVASITFRAYSNGEVSQTWVDTDPNAPSEICFQHADPENPSELEFAQLPEIVGEVVEGEVAYSVATVATGPGPTLVYELIDLGTSDVQGGICPLVLEPTWEPPINH